MPAKLKAVRTDKELECTAIDEGLRAMGYTLALLPETISEDELVAEVADADLLLMCYTPITARVINAASKLKAIIKFGVGIDAIDIEAAKACAIPVVNIPEYAEETVAEGAFALMIALAKKLTPLDRAMKTEGWLWPTPDWIGSDIAGKTVGLIGCGRIGKSMARMAGAGFRANVVGYDPYVDQATMKNAGITKYDDLGTMLTHCDFVSIHCVLNDQTHHLIGARQLEHMKPTAILINVSRGAIVDEAALVAALEENRIGGAGLDVYACEPLNKTNHPMSALYAMDNVILMPHLTFYTQEAMQRLSEDTLARCAEVKSGKPVLVKSDDPRLTSQTSGVVFAT